MHISENAASRTATIARLNDDARLGLDRRARIMITRNCLETFRICQEEHPAIIQAQLLAAFRRCEFATDSPEHDFASILFRERKVWMKIDLYEKKFVKNRAQRGTFSVIADTVADIRGFGYTTEVLVTGESGGAPPWSVDENGRSPGHSNIEGMPYV